MVPVCVSGWVWALDRAKPRGSVAGNTQIDATRAPAGETRRNTQAGQGLTIDLGTIDRYLDD